MDSCDFEDDDNTDPACEADQVDGGKPAGPNPDAIPMRWAYNLKKSGGKTMKRPIIIYHGNCYDGFGAAWAAWKKFGDEAEYIPAFYGMEFPAIPDNGEGYIFDFSFPRSVLIRNQEKIARLLDHHKTAQNDLQRIEDELQRPFCTFDMGKSGAVLAWEFLHPDKNVPKLLQYIQDSDLWTFALPHSRIVSQWIRSWPMEFEQWDFLQDIFQSQPELDAILNEAVAIDRFHRQMVDVMANNSWIENIGGYDVPVTNATVFTSEVGNELCLRNPDKPFAAYFLDRKDGKRQWGLRSQGEFDVSEVARRFGGGGHKNSAGFTTKRGTLSTER